ncbi:hypothetical protein ES707_07874 [subsurface metagenome]
MQRSSKHKGIKPIKAVLIRTLLTVFVFFTIACSQTAIKNNNDSIPVINDIFPRLIITRQNINDFVKKAETTHKHLFELSIQLADDFMEEEPPQAQNAHNKYRRIGESLPSLGLAYHLTKDDKYLRGAEKWIRSLLAVETWEGSSNLGRSSWITGIAQIYDWLYHHLDDDLKKKIIRRLTKEAEIVKNTAASHRALSNHLLIETSAIGTVGLILEEDDPNRKRFLMQANEWTEYIIHNAPLDGSWGEGVQYWQYGLGYFLRYLEGAQTSGYHDYFTDYHWLKKTGRFPIHFSVPDKLTRVINFSDCGTDRYIPAFLLYLPAGKYRDGVVQDFALKIQATKPHKLSWFDFLTYDASVDPIEYKSVEDNFHHFEDHGFVTMRSSWEEDATLVGFRCGPAPGHANQAKPERISNRGYGPGHQHPNINHFVIYANGTWLAIDPGYTHLKETRNHNTILVNGRGQAGAGEKWLDYMAFQNREPAPKIMLAETTGEYDYIIGNAGNIYVNEAGLEYFERQLMFIKPNVIIIADRLKGKDGSTYEWSLQANEIANIEKMSSGYEVEKEKASLSVFPLLPSGVYSKVTERMVEANDVHGSPDYEQDEALLRTIKLKTTGIETTFLVVLTVNKPGDTRPVVSINDGLIHIVKDGKEILVKHQPERELSAKILDL